MDAADSLAHFRDAFILPPDRLNFDGNSLGSLPRQTPERLAHCVSHEWGHDLITSWASNGWFEAPLRVGNKLAQLIGANEGEVLIADSVSVNIFKALAAALSLQPGRKIILSESGNFPTDLYIMQGLADFSAVVHSHCADTPSKNKPATATDSPPDLARASTNEKAQSVSRQSPAVDSFAQAGINAGASVPPSATVVNKVVAPSDLVAHLTEEVAVLLLTHIHYKTAAIKDMAALTAAAHAKGILVIWDLSHSVGSVPLELSAIGVDFALGCGYKFLNGGPGAPAFIYVAKKHQAAALPVLSGWMGHQDPFAFTDEYQAAEGIQRFRCGTPGILGLTALESGIDLFLQTDLQQLRRKAIALSRLFIQLMEPLCETYGFVLVSPLEDEHRGGHVSYYHPEGHAIYQAIKKRGIISDYRTPGVLRFGITPLYLRFVDIFTAVQSLQNVMESKAWDVPEYKTRASIT